MPPEKAPRRGRLLDRELDTVALLRQRDRINARLEAELAKVRARRPAAPPPPASPVLALPAALVVTTTSLAVLVRVWGLEVWIPKSAIHHADPDTLLADWSGDLEISSRWAASVGLPPLPKAPACAGRSTT